MNILIDIKHPAQLNLFKGLAKKLKSNHWKIIICYLDRGKLPKIIEREYEEFARIKVGSSRGTKWSIFWSGNVMRTYDFLKIIKNENINICVAASSAPLALAARLSNIPVIQFYDDPERKRINKINEILSTRIFFPPIVKEKAKIGIFNCLKEWSYLSPKYFKPSLETLDKYSMRPHSYMFVREVSNKSFNYYHQEDAIVCGLSDKIQNDLPVLLSLEDKTLKNKFPSHWILLEEPIEDIHSLIFFSKLVLSSGDSMAREGAMLGIPSIYCGIREMKANELLIQKNLLNHNPGNSALTSIELLASKEFDPKFQYEIRNELLEEWDDMVDFMENQILKYKK